MDAITRSYTTTFPQINHIREAEFQKHVQRILTGIDTLISIVTLLHFMHATYNYHHNNNYGVSCTYS